MEYLCYCYQREILKTYDNSEKKTSKMYAIYTNIFLLKIKCVELERVRQYVALSMYL